MRSENSERYWEKPADVDWEAVHSARQDIDAAQARFNAYGHISRLQLSMLIWAWTGYPTAYPVWGERGKAEVITGFAAMPAGTPVSEGRLRYHHLADIARPGSAWEQRSGGRMAAWVDLLEGAQPDASERAKAEYRIVFNAARGVTRPYAAQSGPPLRIADSAEFGAIVGPPPLPETTDAALREKLRQQGESLGVTPEMAAAAAAAAKQGAFAQAGWEQ